MKTSRFVAVALAAAVLSPAGHATDVSLATRPLQNGTLVTIKPNVYFVFDDSGSMGDNFMPDDVPGCDGGGSDVDCATKTKYAFWAAQCNGVAYDANTTYLPPMKADTTEFALPSNAPGATVQGDGFGVATAYFSGSYTPFAVKAGSGSTNVSIGTGSKTITLSSTGTIATTTGNWVLIYPAATGADGANRMLGKITAYNSTTRALTVNVTSSAGSGSYSYADLRVMQVPRYYAYTGSQPAMSYSYDSSGLLDTTSTFYRECNSNIGSTPGSSVFTDTPVYAASARQNYVNWFSFYRVRINTMKTAMTRAFGNLANPTNYRIGYTTINNAVNRFVKIDDWCAGIPGATCTHRVNFYNSLINTKDSGSTPLRTALSNAGRMFSGLTSGSSSTYYWTTNDPVQYSCQRNFSIMATDGYWNTGNGLDLAGNTIGNWDGSTQPSLPGGKPAPLVTWPTPRPLRDSSNRANTLSDVAYYYYANDLRNWTGKCTSLLTGQPTCNAKTWDPDYGTAGGMRAPFMNTYTIGLGVKGTLAFPGDLAALKSGAKNWPDPGTGGDVRTVDDLWHAALNGHGQYYSAKTADEISSSLNAALLSVQALAGSGSAAAAANLQPVAGDEAIYVGNYETMFWYGDVKRCSIDLDTGSVGSCDSATTANSQLLNSGHKAQATADSRNIMFRNSTGTLVDFNETNLVASGFGATTFPATSLSQYAAKSAADKAKMTTTNLINYLRGQWAFEEGHGASGEVFRNRLVSASTTELPVQRVLGDIVNSPPVFIGKPVFSYDETNNPGYDGFKATSRTGMLYVGANDGMLHAFRGDTLEELWAFVPTPVIGNLYRLADSSYGPNHRYFVDGPLTAGDAYINGSWRTILVGGLGGGGKGYFALDVTVPSSPQLLWEFTTASTGGTNLGYTYGNPIITKRKCAGADTSACPWVVIFASGYNTANGKAYLYMVNAGNGSLLPGYPVEVSSTSDPAYSGMGRIANWVDNTLLDNTTRYVYGGDLYGRVWRFDVSGSSSPNQLAWLSYATAGDQPITARPELGVSPEGTPTVFVGTGRYLGIPDITDGSTYYSPKASGTQSIYAIKDAGHAAAWGTSFRSNAVKQTISGSGSARNVSYEKVQASDPGWYVDLGASSESNERVAVDPVLQVGRLAVGTFVPGASSDVCEVNGHSYMYLLDYMPSRKYTPNVGQDVFALPSNAVVVGITTVKLPNGKIVNIATTSDDQRLSFGSPQPAPGSTPRRVSWRELVR
jgi:type IV pilus assembly protein PilY1